jgi:hypothetical protein
MIARLFAFWLFALPLKAIPGNLTVRRIQVNEPALYQRNGTNDPRRIITGELKYSILVIECGVTGSAEWGFSDLASKSVCLIFVWVAIITKILECGL